MKVYYFTYEIKSHPQWFCPPNPSLVILLTYSYILRTYTFLMSFIHLNPIPSDFYTRNPSLIFIHESHSWWFVFYSSNPSLVSFVPSNYLSISNPIFYLLLILITRSISGNFFTTFFKFFCILRDETITKDLYQTKLFS